MSLPQQTFTMGVEEEYQIIDPLTRELSSTADIIFPKAQELLGNAVQYETILSQIEVVTPVCFTLADVHEHLTRLRSGISNAASDAKKLIAAAGTHPFSHWSEQEITPKARYEDLIETFGQLIREQVIFGCHVHVGVADREIATLILSHARPWLAPLLALTANSPFWLGADTSYDDYRTGLWWTIPQSGPPPCFSSYSEYRGLIQDLIDTGSLEDATKIYWDLRLSERFSTIEFRITDVCMTVDETVMVAGLIRALVRTCYELVMREVPYLPVSNDVIRAAHWRAARYGLDGELVDIQHMRSVPAHQLIEQLLAFLRPALEAEGDWELVEPRVRQILRTGNGATRQRDIYKRSGRLEDVVDFVVAETNSF
ncbi:MAG: glutamate--cysteine ligase [Ktedonobacteraceae bacterium]